jgi:hypothetical protein
VDSIIYHTRLQSDNTEKIVGGSFDGQFDADTVERLVKAFFTVTVKPSGHAVFVDRDGREVSLYVSVDACETSTGKKALAEWKAQAVRVEQERKALEDSQSAAVAEAMSGLSHIEILRRLHVDRPGF